MLHPLGNRLQGHFGYAKPALSPPADFRPFTQSGKDEVRFSASPSLSSSRPRLQWLEHLTGCWRGKPEATGERPLHEQAGKALEQLSEENYQKACGAAPAYTYRGESPNYYIGLTLPARAKRSTMPNLDLHKILRMMQEKAKGEKIQVLDIGCGAGEFIKGVNEPGRIKAYGITAKGFKRPSDFPKKQYLYGNAQNLLKLISNKLALRPGRQGVFDVIVSQMTFRYLPDPLGALTQAYTLLKPGGLLIVDRLNTHGINDDISKVNQYLKKKGFQAHFFQKPGDSLFSLHPLHPEIGPIIIQKSAHLPMLDLPVRYGDIQDGLPTYQLDAEKLQTAGVTATAATKPASWNEAVDRFHHICEKIGLSEECLHYYQSPDTQAPN